ncbi:hypothetical protein DL96DRAFT_328456 [Flagelloscypha sp. PMI_526]|nr:hypothetical protein DL96DRAFT_328456 [Flagelloscypha sp. PMI_526]
MGSFPNPIDPSRDELFRQFLTAQSHGIDPCQIQIPPEFIATRVPSRFDPMPGPFYSLPSKLRDRASPLIVPYIHKVLRDRECQRVREMEIRLKGVPTRPQKETPLSGQDALALLKGSGRSEVVAEPREDDVMDDEFMDGPEIIVNEKIERLSTSDVLDEDVDVVPSEIANAPPYHPPWSHRFQRTFSSAFQNYASQLQQYICGPPQPTPHVHGWAGTVVIQVLQTLRACPMLERYRYSAPFLSRLHHPSDILQASILHLVELSRNVPMAMQTDKRKTQDCACHRTRSFVSVYSPTLPDLVPQSQPPGYDNPKKNVLRRDTNSNCPRISNAALPRELIKVRGYRFKRSEEDGLPPRRVVVLTEDLAPNEGLSPRDCAKAVASAIARDQTQHQSISESPLPPCRLEVVGSTDHPGLPLMITTVSQTISQWKDALNSLLQLSNLLDSTPTLQPALARINSPKELPRELPTSNGRVHLTSLKKSSS